MFHLAAMLHCSKTSNPATHIKNWFEGIVKAKLPPPGASARSAIVAFFLRRGNK
jgi:hypothetical protein